MHQLFSDFPNAMLRFKHCVLDRVTQSAALSSALSTRFVFLYFGVSGPTVAQSAALGEADANKI